MELTNQTVHTVCEGMEAPHDTIENLCHGAQAIGMLNQDSMPPGMTPSQQSQAQSRGPALCQLIDAIQQKTIENLITKKDMPLHLKAFLRIRKQLHLKQGMLYRKYTDQQ